MNIEFWKNKAKKHYTKLPYHNYNHALEVLNNCELLIERCRKYKVPVNEDVVRIAALYHDAGYEEVEKDKEAHSAKIAKKELEEENLKELVKPVINTIMATEITAVPKTNEEKILRAADIRSMAADWNTFMCNNEKIKEEFRAKKIKFTEEEWKEGCKKVFSHYLSEEIKLTPEFEKDKWHDKVQKNLKRFMES